MVREAIAAIGAQDTAMAVRIVARHRTDAMNHERWQEIDHWIALFPGAIVEQEPVLALTHAWVEHIRMKLLEVEPTVTRFARRLENDELEIDAEMRRTLLGETSTVQGAIAFWSRRFDDSRAHAARALDLLRSARTSAASLTCSARSRALRRQSRCRRSYSRDGVERGSGAHGVVPDAAARHRVRSRLPPFRPAAVDAIPLTE
ncbi:MAG: hypothetical protein IPF53_08070 [Blastocatellia bacterium]|nr:hypothetical protein [Blastocatellia bacterium]